jgi:hypothetical protein
MPADSAVINCPVLWRNLMENYLYTGYPEDAKSQDWMTQTVKQKYISGFLALVECEKAYGDTANIVLVSDQLKSVFRCHPDSLVR